MEIVFSMMKQELIDGFFKIRITDKERPAYNEQSRGWSSSCASG